MTAGGREELLVTLASMVLALPDDRAAGRRADRCGLQRQDHAGRRAGGRRRRRPAERWSDLATTTSTSPGPPPPPRAASRPRATSTTRSTRRRCAGWCSTRSPQGAPRIVPASYDLADDRPRRAGRRPWRRHGVGGAGRGLVPAGPGARGGRWDLAVMIVAEPGRVIERGRRARRRPRTPEQVRELYLRRYLAAEALHQERDDPWSRADVVVDHVDRPGGRPRMLGST